MGEVSEMDERSCAGDAGASDCSERERARSCCDLRLAALPVGAARDAVGVTRAKADGAVDEGGSIVARGLAVLAAATADWLPVPLPVLPVPPVAASAPGKSESEGVRRLLGGFFAARADNDAVDALASGRGASMGDAIGPTEGPLSAVSGVADRTREKTGVASRGSRNR